MAITQKKKVTRLFPPQENDTTVKLNEMQPNNRWTL